MTPPVPLRGFPHWGTTPAAGASPAVAFARGLLRGLPIALAAQRFFTPSPAGGRGLG